MCFNVCSSSTLFFYNLLFIPSERLLIYNNNSVMLLYLVYIECIDFTLPQKKLNSKSFQSGLLTGAFMNAYKL